MDARMDTLTAEREPPLDPACRAGGLEEAA
jgi:hypothetical protein